MLADGDDIPVFQNGLLNRPTVQKGAVLAVGVFQYEAVGLLEEDGVVTGYGIVVDDQMMVGVSPDGESVDSIKGKLVDGSILELDE
jgi:hypothetical protein